MTDLDGDGHYDCIPAVDNFQIISQDDGLTWGPITNISSFLGEHRGLLPGPGTGTYIADMDRILFAGHYQTAERPDGRVVVYYSDDGGDDINNSLYSVDNNSICQVRHILSLLLYFPERMRQVLCKPVDLT